MVRSSHILCCLDAGFMTYTFHTCWAGDEYTDDLGNSSEIIKLSQTGVCILLHLLWKQKIFLKELCYPFCYPLGFSLLIVSHHRVG